MLEQPDIKLVLGPLLRELGLKEQEIDLYTYSLALGPVSIAVLAQYLQISPPNVYKLIANLEAHGLTQFSKRKRYGRTFIVESPDVLRSKLDHKRREIGELAHRFQETLPDLLANYHQGETPTKIRILETPEQLRQVLRDLFDDGKKELMVFGSMESFVESIAKDKYYELASERVEKGVALKALIFPGPIADWMKNRPESDCRTLRLLKTEHTFVTSFQASSRRAIIWQPNAPLALLIEDQFIVQMLRGMFLMLWERAA